MSQRSIAFSRYLASEVLSSVQAKELALRIPDYDQGR